MPRPRARKTDNRVSMEAATSLTGRKKELASRKGNLEGLRTALRTADRDKTIATLHRIREVHGPMEYNRALPLINPTYLGMDVIPEKIADMKSMKPRQKRK